METINFKKLFLKNVCAICLLLLGSTAFTINSSDEEYENFKILMTSKNGLQFFKEDSYDGRKIIYDCGLGLRDSGTILLDDEYHPEYMTSLIVKNCYNLTLGVGCYSYDCMQKLRSLREVKVINVASLTLSKESYSEKIDSRGIVEVIISNVRFLYPNNFFHHTFGSGVFLKLRNVTIDNLGQLFSTYSPKNLFNLYLKNVKIEETETHAFFLKETSNHTLTVEDSHFENVHAEAFAFKGTVHIINSTFGFLDEAAFTVNSSSPFLFSGNHVKRMLNPFYIMSSEVNVIDNTFDSIENPWLSKITGPEIQSFTILNITGNIVNHWNHNLFYLNSQNFPGPIIFEGNYLNCSCKNAITLAYKFENYITEVFLNKHQKNYCQNLGNCPLYKALDKSSGICQGTFRCPEDQNINDEKMWPTHIKAILSVLNNIDTKLDHIVSRYDSPLADKPN